MRARGGGGGHEDSEVGNVSGQGRLTQSRKRAGVACLPSLTVVLVEAGQITVIALIELLTLERLESLLTNLLEDDGQSVIRTSQDGRVSHVKLGLSALLEQLSTFQRFLATERGQVRVLPAGEQVQLVPVEGSSVDAD